MSRILVLMVCALALVPVHAKADSQDACAIWLCLPGGFPSGCGGAYGEFKHRIKKGRAPLPELSSCTTGPNGETTSGRYQLGYERYFPCDDGFILREEADDGRAQAKCFTSVCAPREGSIRLDEGRVCSSYDAKIRPKPSYVEMWVEGQYLGQFFY